MQVRNKMIEFKSECPNCESQNFSFEASTVNRSNVANGRLSGHDIEPVMILGCLDCSETVKVFPASEIAEFLNQKVLKNSKV